MIIADRSQVELAEFLDVGIVVSPDADLFNLVWEVRPIQLINIVPLKLLRKKTLPFALGGPRIEADGGRKLVNEAMMSSSLGAWAANTLGIPYTVVTPGGGEIPGTSHGMQALLFEQGASVAKMLTIVRVNGLFGPDVDNEIRSVILADKPHVDDKTLVNPVHQCCLARFLWLHTPRRGKTVVHLGDKKAQTWFEFFSLVHPNVRPWVDQKKAADWQRELNWRWRGGENVKQPLHWSDGHLRRWLMDLGSDVIPA